MHIHIHVYICICIYYIYICTYSHTYIGRPLEVMWKPYVPLAEKPALGPTPTHTYPHPFTTKARTPTYVTPTHISIQFI